MTNQYATKPWHGACTVLRIHHNALYGEYLRKYFCLVASAHNKNTFSRGVINA